MKSYELEKGERYFLSFGRIVWYDGSRARKLGGEHFIEYEFHDVTGAAVIIKKASYLDEINGIEKY